MSSDYIVSWDIHTHETRMLAYSDGYKYAQAPGESRPGLTSDQRRSSTLMVHSRPTEPLGYDYRSVNESDQLRLPPGMLAEIASIPLPE